MRRSFLFNAINLSSPLYPRWNTHTHAHTQMEITGRPFCSLFKRRSAAADALEARCPRRYRWDQSTLPIIRDVRNLFVWLNHRANEFRAFDNDRANRSRELATSITPAASIPRSRTETPYPASLHVAIYQTDCHTISRTSLSLSLSLHECSSTRNGPKLETESAPVVKARLDRSRFDPNSRTNRPTAEEKKLTKGEREREKERERENVG